MVVCHNLVDYNRREFDRYDSHFDNGYNKERMIEEKYLPYNYIHIFDVEIQSDQQKENSIKTNFIVRFDKVIISRRILTKWMSTEDSSGCYLTVIFTLYKSLRQRINLIPGWPLVSYLNQWTEIFRLNERENKSYRFFVCYHFTCSHSSDFPIKRAYSTKPMKKVSTKRKKVNFVHSRAAVTASRFDT